MKDFLKSKMDKHGGPVGLARAIVTKPSRMASGGRGTRSSDPNPEFAPEVIKEAMATVPTELDEEGFKAVAPAMMITESRPGTYQVGGTDVAVYRYQGALYAIDSACTHEDGPLGESEVEEGGIVSCPYHDWRFELSTGACLTDASRPVACFAVKEKDGFVWIGRKTSEGTMERGGEHDDGLMMDE